VDAARPEGNELARTFAPIAGTYDRCASLLSLGQDPSWRRLLVEHRAWRFAFASAAERKLVVLAAALALALVIMRVG
jgi:hypothetical protein